MCDCYNGKCEACGAFIPIHIGDFSAGREQVKAYCPDHHEEAWKLLLRCARFQAIVFTSQVTKEDCWEDDEEEEQGLPKSWLGRRVVFVVAMPRGVDIN
jgi:hypothetical protein